MLTNLTSQDISVNMPDDVCFRRAPSSRICVLAFVKRRSLRIGSYLWLGVSSSIGHSRVTPTHITSRNVARTRRKQLGRLLKNSRIFSQNAFNIPTNDNLENKIAKNEAFAKADEEIDKSTLSLPHSFNTLVFKCLRVFEDIPKKITVWLQ